MPQSASLSARLSGLALLATVFAPLPAIAQQDSGRLMFVDSRTFDGALSRQFDQGGQQVEVQVEGRLSINQIPPRLDKWIARVADSGSVEVKPAESQARTRSLFSLVGMVFSGLQGLQEEAMLRSAERYNAVIYYRKDAAGDALVERIVFTKRAE